MPEINIFSTGRGNYPRRRIAALARKILSAEKKKSGVNIILTDDRALADLNRRFRRKTGATDVLSFPAGMETGLLGEIYISRQTARLQAGEYGVTVGNEILRLVCHGLLHLCGYDHHRSSGARVMRSREEKYLGGKALP